jgi:hypothetical protein
MQVQPGVRKTPRHLTQTEIGLVREVPVKEHEMAVRLVFGHDPVYS